jgi:hypothetical protein
LPTKRRERIGEDMPEILNKKQLEDAIKCRDFGTGCCDKNKKRCSAGGVGICIENAACTALTYREMLERIEWCCLTDYGIGRAPTCPFCGNVKSEGHKPDCEWVVAMKWE